MLKRLNLAILFCLLLSGCIFDPAFDMSSWETYQASLASVRAKLGDDDLRRLDIALRYLAVENILKDADIPMVSNIGAAISSLNPRGMFIQLRPKISGKSSARIIRDLSVRLDAEISQAEARLQNKEKAATAIEVTAPGYYWKRNGRIEQPAIEFAVFNGGKSPISRIHFRLALVTPNRSIPWARQDYIENFKGGLEPREKRQLSLQPRGDWIDPQLKYLPDAKLKVDILNYEDADGTRMISIDRESLELKRKIRAALA
jgi:hypothetical protein